MRQGKPKKNNSTPIYELVLADYASRVKIGKKRYGVYLQANNGRDALRDAYEEAMDLTLYLRQKIEEERMKDKRRNQRIDKSQQEHLPVAAKKNTKDWCKGIVGRLHHTYWSEAGTHILHKKCMVCSKIIDRAIKPYSPSSGSKTAEARSEEWDAAWKEYREQESERRKCKLF